MIIVIGVPALQPGCMIYLKPKPKSECEADGRQARAQGSRRLTVVNKGNRLFVKPEKFLIVLEMFRGERQREVRVVSQGHNV